LRKAKTQALSFRYKIGVQGEKGSVKKEIKDGFGSSYLAE
jgi:hypothetical protein